MSIAQRSSAVERRLNLWITQRMDLWLKKHLPPTDTLTLHRSNIFILPTAHGLLFLLTAVVILIAAINYALSMAFGLAFLMISLFLLTILHTFYNLRGLTLRGLGAEPAHAGEHAIFTIQIKRQVTRRHEELELHFVGGDTVYTGLLDQTEKRLQLAIPVSRRGLFSAPRLIVQSTFPLGLWRAWSRVDLAQTCLVYPQAMPCSVNHGNTHAASGESSATTVGVDDFHGLRAYQPGDSLKQIAWKNLARGQGLKVKQFVDGVSEQFLFDWHMFSGMDTEQRLSCLCYLILQMTDKNVDYGLSMPGVIITPDRGDAHQKGMLEVLALWH